MGISWISSTGHICSFSARAHSGLWMEIYYWAQNLASLTRCTWLSQLLPCHFDLSCGFIYVTFCFNWWLICKNSCNVICFFVFLNICLLNKLIYCRCFSNNVLYQITAENDNTKFCIKLLEHSKLLPCTRSFQLGIAIIISSWRI